MSSPFNLFTRPDAALLALRPSIATASSIDTELTVGSFLHTTLRPILKLQNDFLLQVVANFVHDHHIRLASLALADQQRQLTELLTRNTKLRYTIIGLITAFFTAAEAAFYRQNRLELNRRLLELAQRRVLDQTAALVAATAVAVVD